MKTAKVSTNAEQTAMMKGVAQRIANAAERYLRENGQTADLQTLQWEFNLTQNKELNAFCMPGGKIVVYEGMMNLVGTDANAADQLAAVIGHEVGHALAKHGQERMSQQVLTQMGSSVLGVALSGKSQQTQQLAALAYGAGAQYGALLPFSRKHELEADYMGLVLMTMAGFDPEASVTLWQKMGAATSARSEFSSTHPSSEHRIAELQKYIPKVKKQYGTAPAATKSKAKSSKGFRIG